MVRNNHEWTNLVCDAVLTINLKIPISWSRCFDALERVTILVSVLTALSSSSRQHDSRIKLGPTFVPTAVSVNPWSFSVIPTLLFTFEFPREKDAGRICLVYLMELWHSSPNGLMIQFTLVAYNSTKPSGSVVYTSQNDLRSIEVRMARGFSSSLQSSAVLCDLRGFQRSLPWTVEVIVQTLNLQQTL